MHVIKRITAELLMILKTILIRQIFYIHPRSASRDQPCRDRCSSFGKTNFAYEESTGCPVLYYVRFIANSFYFLPAKFYAY